MLVDQDVADRVQHLLHVVEHRHGAVQAEVKVRQRAVVGRGAGEGELLRLHEPCGVVPRVAHPAAAERGLGAPGRAVGHDAPRCGQTLQYLQRVVGPARLGRAAGVVDHGHVVAPGQDFEDRL